MFVYSLRDEALRDRSASRRASDICRATAFALSALSSVSIVCRRRIDLFSPDVLDATSIPDALPPYWKAYPVGMVAHICCYLVRTCAHSLAQARDILFYLELLAVLGEQFDLGGHVCWV